MSRRGISKNDRKVMILLVILLAVFGAYLGIRETRASKGLELIESFDTRDTVYIVKRDVKADSLSLEVEQGFVNQRDTMAIKTDRYPGPPERVKYISKLQEGATIDLNSADTLLLMRVPGIGPSYARRICKYRDMLGGYYVVEQLQEVYGMDRERYDLIAPYMTIKTPVTLLVISEDSIPRHPYLAWRHTNKLRQMVLDREEITWTKLMESGVFSHDDSLRLAPYLSFSEIR